MALVVLLLAVGACTADEPSAGSTGTSPGPGTAPEPVRGGTIVVGTAGEVNGFNPLSSQWSGPAYIVGRAVMDPLVVMDRNGDWQPYLAESFTANADFTVWTIGLRPGIAFHNGEALDADALALYLEAAVSSPLSSQGFPEKPQIAVVDELHVSLTFTEPWSAMPAVFVEQPGYVIAPEQVRSGATDRPIGTGPFVFEEWVAGEHLTVRRNPDYWRAGLPYLDSIEFRPMADPGARDNSIRTGGADVIERSGLGQSALDDVASEGFTIIDDVDNVGATNLLMNSDASQLGDRDVRLAVVSAIDREAYRDTVLDDSFALADQPYPEGNRWNVDVDYPAYDPDLARRLVDEHERENGPLQLRMLAVAGTPLVGPQFLQQALNDVGIEVQVEALELATYVQRLIGGDYETVFLGAFFGAPDPDGNVHFLRSAAAAPEALIKLNFARYRNPEVDAALVAQRRTDDADARRAEWAKVWRAMSEDLPYAFLAHERYALIATAEVHGLDTPTTPEGTPLPAINRWTPFFTQVHREP